MRELVIFKDDIDIEYSGSPMGEIPALIRFTIGECVINLLVKCYESMQPLPVRHMYLEPNIEFTRYEDKEDMYNLLTDDEADQLRVDQFIKRSGRLYFAYGETGHAAIRVTREGFIYAIFRLRGGHGNMLAPIGVLRRHEDGSMQFDPLKARTVELFDASDEIEIDPSYFRRKRSIRRHNPKSKKKKRRR